MKTANLVHNHIQVIQAHIQVNLSLPKVYTTFVVIEILNLLSKVQYYLDQSKNVTN